jgi:transposase-like protein
MWKCRSCRKQFSPKAGTIFEVSPIGLDRWLIAIWMVANAEERVGSYKLHRLLGVTQTTAQFMLRRIRVAVQARKPARDGSAVVAAACAR